MLPISPPIRLIIASDFPGTKSGPITSMTGHEKPVAGPRLRLPDDDPQAGIHNRRSAVARSGDWREYRYLQSDQYYAFAAAAFRGSREDRGSVDGSIEGPDPAKRRYNTGLQYIPR